MQAFQLFRAVFNFGHGKGSHSAKIYSSPVVSARAKVEVPPGTDLGVNPPLFRNVNVLTVDTRCRELPRLLLLLGESP